MSCPAEWPTNLYQIGETDYVPWTKYQIRTSDVRKTGRGPQVEHPDSAVLLEVQDALFELRNHGLHLFFDIKESTLWHFDCLRSKSLPVDVNAVISHHLTTDILAIEKVTHGVLTAKDLATTSVNASFYSSFVKSVLLSALNSLASQPSCYSFGLHADSSNIQAVYATDVNDLGELLSLWSLRLRWCPSGEIVLSISEYSSDRYLFLSHILPSLSREPFTLCKIDVLLSPNGRLAAYAGAIPTSFVESRKEDVERIRRIGLNVSESDPWVRLKIDQLNSSTQLLWPANLCILSSKSLYLNPLETAQFLDSESDGFVDPIREVETWYEQRSEREKAITARIQREEVERRQKEAQQASQEHQDRMDFRSPAANLLSAHDASGIYPTPPDGLLHHAVHQDSSDSRAQDEEHLEIGSRAYGIVEVDSGHSPRSDLFGDLDENGMTANGVTEDDFNFFDDTRIAGDPESGHLGLVSDTEMPDLLSASPVCNEIEVSDLEDLSSLGVQPPDEASTAQSQDNADSGTGTQGEILTTDPPPDRINSEPSKHFEIPYESLSECLKNPPTNPAERALPRETIDRISKPPETASLSCPPAPDTMNGKYDKGGKYGFNKSPQALGVRPSIRSGAKQMALPRLHGTRMSDAGLKVDSPEESSLSSDSEMEGEIFVPGTSQDSAQRSSYRSQDSVRNISFEASEDIDGSIDLALMILDSPFPLSKIGDASSNTSLTTDLESCVQDTIRELRTQNRIDMIDSATARYEISGRDPDLVIQNAQILAEQMIFDDTAAFSNAEIGSQLSLYWLPKDERLPLKWNSQRNVLSQIFPGLQRRRLQDLTDLRGTALDSLRGKTHKTLMQRRQQGSTGLGIGCWDSIDAPYVVVRRGDNMVEMMSSALPFWEDLSLGPLSGDKHIHCVSIIPSRCQKQLQRKPESQSRPNTQTTQSNYVHDLVQSYVDQMSNSYQSFKLGTCKVLRGQKPCAVAADTLEFLLHCEYLGRSLSTIDLDEQVLVVLMIDYSADRSISPFLCEGFVKLLTSYEKNVVANRRPPFTDMVLEILPINSIRPPHGISIPSIDACGKLAVKLYERSPRLPKGHATHGPHVCAPSMKLAKTLPKALSFKIASNNVFPFPECDYLHLAYTWSWNSPWLAASWSDNQGDIQWNTAYHIGEPQRHGLTDLSSVFTEIIETSVGLRKPHQGPRVLLVAKSTSMSMEELDLWRSILQLCGKEFSRTSIVVIDPKPDVRFEIPKTDGQIHLSNGNQATRKSETVVAAPSLELEAAGDSHSVLPVMSADEGNSNARLIDISDATWGVHLARPLDQPRVTDTDAPFLNSSFLIKRGGRKAEDGVISLTINAVHCSAPSPPDMLESLPIMYRRLALLAGHRGVIDPIKQILPIHVAASMKAHTALTRLIA